MMSADPCASFCDRCGGPLPSGRVRFCSLRCGLGPRTSVDRACKKCGATFAITRLQPNKKYCSDACRPVHNAAAPRPCGTCGVVFTPDGTRRLYCSKPCYEGRRRAVRARARRMVPRSTTLAIKKLTQARMRELASMFSVEELVAVDDARPHSRAECADLPRPCPFVACRHHLYLDVNHETGSIKFNYPAAEPHELVETCALDVADRGEHTLETVGLLLNVTRERLRQIEVRALHKLKLISPSPDELGAALLRGDQLDEDADAAA